VNKRVLQLIASVFLLIGGAIFYAEFWSIPQKGGIDWLFVLVTGLIMFIGVLIFVWTAQRR
jgi:uncharacterized membrane protein YfcA